MREVGTLNNSGRLHIFRQSLQAAEIHRRISAPAGFVLCCKVTADAQTTVAGECLTKQIRQFIKKKKIRTRAFPHALRRTIHSLSRKLDNL
jgi:hypothetical protein